MIGYLWALLNLNVGSHARKLDAVKSLGRYGAKSVKPLIKSLNKEDWPLQIAIADSLDKAGGSEAVAQLIPLLTDIRPGVRVSAAISIGNIGDRSGVEPLIKILDSATKKGAMNVDMIEPIAFALGKIGDNRGVIPLVKAINERSGLWTTWKAIIQALSVIGDDRAVSPLVELLNSCGVKDSCEVRSTVCNVSKPCLEALWCILARHAEKLSRSSLEKIINLPGHIKYAYCTHSPSSSLPSHWKVDNIDCSQIKNYARELLM